VARNLADFPLGTCITREGRKEVEKIVYSVLLEFDGEYKGKYIPLESMTEDEKKLLIDDHFLFKNGDKNHEASGLERNWPEARGIFFNEEKTFLVWINEEDQLRIISMQKGSNIMEVFKRLSIVAAKIEEKAKFAKDDHFGYISTCPSNMGTGMRASVHIKLPKLMTNKDMMQSIADKYSV